MVLKANPGYWGDDRPKVETITIYNGLAITEARDLALFSEGKIDITPVPFADEVEALPEPALGLKGLRHAARTTCPKALCATGWYRLLRFLPELWQSKLILPRATPGSAPEADLSPDDPALMSFTSGSTGQPKCIVRSHAFLMAQNDAIAPLLASEADRDLVAFPVFVLVNLAAGRTSILPDWKLSAPGQVSHATLTARIRATSATRALIPPVLCERLAEGEVPDTLRAVFTGGGPVFPDVMQRLAAKRPDLRIAAVYGSTEAEPIAEIETSEIRPEDWRAMADGAGLLAGHPVRDLSLRLQDGEIQVAGPHVNKGYLDPAQNAVNKITEGETTWHRTGDAGRLDDQGRLWLLGRWSDAEGPHPFQIETAARFWPGVTRAALTQVDGEPVLALEGQSPHKDDWKTRAQTLGITRIYHLADIPMDARHASKVNTAALQKRLSGKRPI